MPVLSVSPRGSRPSISPDAAVLSAACGCGPPAGDGFQVSAYRKPLGSWQMLEL